VVRGWFWNRIFGIPIDETEGFSKCGVGLKLHEIRVTGGKG
jgi:hypothetical protein